MNEAVKEKLTTALTEYCRDGMFPDEAADAALATFRQWLADEGLVVVPREATKEMQNVTDAWWADRLWEAMIAAAPDVFGKP